MNDKEKEKEEMRKRIDEYLDVLIDAQVQRNPGSLSKAVNQANVIYEIAVLLKQNNIRTLEETIDILVSVIAMPIQLVERDPTRRAVLMGELASAFVTHIVNLQVKDTVMKGSEIEGELNKLRDLNSKFFKQKQWK